MQVDDALGFLRKMWFTRRHRIICRRCALRPRPHQIKGHRTETQTATRSQKMPARLKLKSFLMKMFKVIHKTVYA
jgi:hypothetical protein